MKVLSAQWTVVKTAPSNPASFGRYKRPKFDLWRQWGKRASLLWRDRPWASTGQPSPHVGILKTVIFLKLSTRRIRFFLSKRILPLWGVVSTPKTPQNHSKFKLFCGFPHFSRKRLILEQNFKYPIWKLTKFQFGKFGCDFTHDRRKLPNGAYKKSKFLNFTRNWPFR